MIERVFEFPDVFRLGLCIAKFSRLGDKRWDDAGRVR